MFIQRQIRFRKCKWIMDTSTSDFGGIIKILNVTGVSRFTLLREGREQQKQLFSELILVHLFLLTKNVSFLDWVLKVGYCYGSMTQRTVQFGRFNTPYQSIQNIRMNVMRLLDDTFWFISATHPSEIAITGRAWLTYLILILFDVNADGDFVRRQYPCTVRYWKIILLHFSLHSFISNR